jgi:hypothetical protein
MAKPLAPGWYPDPKRKAGKQAVLGRRGVAHRAATCIACRAQEAANLAVGARQRACAVPDRSVLERRESRLADLAIGRYRGADILDSGQAGPGEKARVNIQADGDVDSWSDEIGNHRLVFMTHNCGAWRLVS